MFPVNSALRLAALQPVQSQVHSAEEPHIRVDPMGGKAGAAGAFGGSMQPPHRRFADLHLFTPTISKQF